MSVLSRTRVLIACCLFAALAWGQEPSVADAARTARKTKPDKPVTKVYDNENLPANATVSTVGEVGVPAEKKPQKSAEGDKKGAPPTREEQLTQARAAISRQKHKIADLESGLNRMERENSNLKALAQSDQATTMPNCGYGWNFTWICVEPSKSDNVRKYEEYVKQRDAKLAELSKERERLVEMEEELAALEARPD